MKTGDRVRYVGTMRKMTGWEGTIMSAPGPRLVDVLWDNGARGAKDRRYLILVSAARLPYMAEPVKGIERIPPKPIKVYDQGNAKRLLGTVTRRPIPALRSSRLEAAVMPRLSLRDFDAEAPTAPCRPVTATRVVFEVDFVTSPCGWEKEAVLRTSEGLELLMQLDTFRLPEETDAQARHRQFYA